MRWNIKDQLDILTFKREVLIQAGVKIFSSSQLGADRRISTTVMEQLTLAAEAWYPSHDESRIPRYVQYILDEHIKPRNKVKEVVNDRGAIVVDGNNQFGQIAMTEIVEIAKREVANHAVFGIRARCNHVGRLAPYATAVAKEGLIVIVCCNAVGRPTTSRNSGKAYGGTNPPAIAVPRRPFRGKKRAICLDFTPCECPEGDLNVLRQAGLPVPEGIILDHEGRPTTDPNVMYDPEKRGVLLPLGGEKSYVMAHLLTMMDMTAGALNDNIPALVEDGLKVAPGTNGILFLVVDPTAFGTSLDDYTGRIEQVVTDIKSLPGLNSSVSDRNGKPLLPGEIEESRIEEAKQFGVPVIQDIWTGICETAASVDVDLSEFQPIAA